MTQNEAARAEEGSDGSHETLQQHQLRRSALRALVQDFKPMWFTWSMNAGILGILCHQNPYTFSGLKDVIASIFFLFDLVLFIIFSLVFIARFAWFRKQAWNEIANDPADLTMIACWPIAFMTLISLIALIVSQASWGGHAFTILAYVLWWIIIPWVYSSLVLVLTTMISKHSGKNAPLPMTMIIPAVTLSTAGVTGGVIASASHHISARMAVPVIIVGFITNGIGLLMGMIFATYLLHQMFMKGWPAPAQIVSVFILLGPMGQSAAALQLLSSAASSGHFAEYNKGTFLTGESALALEAACVLIALLLFGLGVITLILAIVAMIDCAIQRKLVWSPMWNAVVFPTGTVTTSALEFAVEMDSPAFKVVTTILIICLVFFFLLNLGYTIHGIYKGQLLIVREDSRVKTQMESQQKER